MANDKAVATMQEFSSSVQQLCSIQAGTESPVSHIPHGHWVCEVLAISKPLKQIP